MNLVRSVLPNAYAAKARGIVLSAIALGAVYVYYLAVDSDDAIPPAAAESMPMPPVVRATSITSPIYIIPDASAQETPRPAALNRDEIARDLQIALAKAHCYDGPVSGRWSAASQAAMSTFLSIANAHLPVGDPDEALLALVSSNSDVTCAARPTLVADASDPRAIAAYDGSSPHTKIAIATDASAFPPSSSGTAAPPDERSMLDHPWAQPDMLVPAAEMKPQAPAASPILTSSIGRADRGAVQDVQDPKPVSAAEPSQAAAVTKVSTAVGERPALRFEGGSVIADERPEPARIPPEAASQPGEGSEASAATAPAAKTAQRGKAKTAKRRTTRKDDSTFGVSFDSIQRSFSSLFD